MIDHELFAKLKIGIKGCSDKRLLECYRLVLEEIVSRKEETKNIKEIVKHMSSLESDW